MMTMVGILQSLDKWRIRGQLALEMHHCFYETQFFVSQPLGRSTEVLSKS
ncbi:hypothetical protein A2U01_0111113, partial [Trifolium medium]|nr:hypothetical protein [Trifolium medium]